MAELKKTGFCVACRALVPLVAPFIGRAAGVAVGSLVGRKAAKSFWGALAIVATTTIVGHLVDKEMAKVCGKCGGAIGSEFA